MQLQLPETHYLRVLPLTKVVTQIVCSHGLVVRTFDIRLVQQVLILRHELRRVAGAEKHRQKQYVQLIPHNWRAKVVKNLHICKNFYNFVADFDDIMEKISKAQVKLVKSLQLKKFRDELNLFVAEGDKCVSELAKSFELVHLYIHSEAINGEAYQREAIIVPKEQLELMSGLRAPQGVIGVFRKSKIENQKSKIENLTLALDGIQDPGNLGTIIRTCDWFGVHDIFCSLDTADCYNPKVVQATMGALARVRVHYVDLPAWLSQQQCPIIGTLLEGKDMYESTLPKEGIIIMGNEGNGISQEVRKLITHPIRIPSYPKNAETSESLNVSIATAIVLAEFRRLEI
jgi:TrmH family RNA methyltransferase